MPTDGVELTEAYRRMLAALAGRTSLETVARTAATTAHDLLRATGASVTRLDHQLIEYVSATGSIAGLQGRTLPVDNSFTGSVIRTGAPLIYDPLSAPASSAARARDDQIRSGVVVPILIDGRVAGTIGVVSDKERFFDKDALTRLEDFADFLALGLERSRDRERLAKTYHFYRIGQLAGFVVDELTRPMHTLAKSLREARAAATALPEEARTDLELQLMESFRDIEEISRVVSDLRTIATDDSDRSPVEIDVLSVLERVADYLRTRIEKVAAFDVNVPTTLPRIRAVPGRLWQIVYALLINALEAIESRPRGVNHVRLSARHVRREIEIRVEDSGCGISDEDLPLVFEPFFTTRTGRQRAGLGLTLVWRHIDALGGTVDVQSEPGERTRFTVTIPVTGRAS